MDNTLRTFYNNENEREAVRAFMIETLRELAADKALDGKPTTGIQDAGDCIDQMFDTLKNKYGIIKPPVITNSR